MLTPSLSISSSLEVPTASIPPPHDGFIVRVLDGLEAELRRPHIKYDQCPGQLRMCIASLQMDQITVDPATWQPALIGASHLQEVTTHFSFESEPVRDFLGFGANLQVRAADGVKHSILGDFFIRFVPRPFEELANGAVILYPDQESLARSFTKIFNPAAPLPVINNEEMEVEPVSHSENLKKRD